MRVLVLLLLSLIINSSRAQIEIGFVEEDRTVPENSMGSIRLQRIGEHLNPIIVSVTALTYNEYTGPIPADFTNLLPDPAEFIPGEREDFVRPKGLNFTFSPGSGQAEVSVPIQLVNDEINELDEGFWLLIESDPSNVDDVTLVREGLALVTINDEDSIGLGFEQAQYTVTEQDGEISNLVFVVKEDNITSEQVLRILVQTSSGSATIDDDFTVTPRPFELVFQPEDEAVPLPFRLFDDLVIEESENFPLFLSINATQQGLQLGTIQSTTVNIIDNENVTVTFNTTNYTITEGEGPLEVCLGVSDPPGLESLGSLLFIGTPDTMSGTATELSDFNFQPQDIILFDMTTEACLPITIIDDLMVESTEMFTLVVTPDPTNPANILFPMNTVSITILDNDVATTPPPQPSPCGSCPLNSQCVPGPEGTMICVCSPGFIGNETECIDIDECDEETDNCDDNAECMNTEGNFTCTCLPGFTGDGVTCTAIICEDLPMLANGTINYNNGSSDSRPIDTVATHTCNVGYILNGNMVRTCQSDGTFSGSPPTCEPIECPPLPGIANGMISYSPDMTPNFTLSTNATYLCDEGFFLDVSMGDEVRTCEDDNGMDAIGQFSGTEPTCIPIECPPLPGIANGMISYSPDMTPNFTLSTNATYLCDEGFFLDVSMGDKVRTCEDDDGMDAIGQFSGTEPTCVPIECPPLPEIANGRISYSPDMTPNFAVGTVATYTCDDGFFLDISSGNTMRTCEDDDGMDVNGRFSGEAPSCIPIECPPLPGIANGMISYSPDMTPNFTLSTNATYLCDEGFFLDVSIGDEVRTCEDDNGMDAIGQFSGTEPICVSIECPLLPGIANGIISYSPDMTPDFTLSTNATYSCDEGFFLDVSMGDEVRTCEDDDGMDAIGQFSGTEPTCVSIECPPLPGIANGMISYSPDMTPDFTLSTNATYSCDEGFFLDVSMGDEVRTCKDDDAMDAVGRFSGEAPSCVAITCENLPVLPNGAISYNAGSLDSRPVDTVATHTCNAGYMLNGNMVRTCQSDGTFSGSPPTCEPVDCGALEDPANGMVQTLVGTTFMATAIYTCNQGYTPNGIPIRNCQANGMWSGPEPTCDDIDECALDILNDCGPNFMCVNTPGGFICVCPPEFEEINGICTEREPTMPPGECVQDSDCASCASCITDMMGVNRCVCNTGLTGDGRTCGDIDECTAGTDTCGNNTICKNTFGSFFCKCVRGYIRGSTMFECEDKDECAKSPKICGKKRVCVNTPGSYRCEEPPQDPTTPRSCTRTRRRRRRRSRRSTRRCSEVDVQPEGDDATESTSRSRSTTRRRSTSSRGRRVEQDNSRANDQIAMTGRRRSRMSSQTRRRRRG